MVYFRVVVSTVLTKDFLFLTADTPVIGGSVAEWLACWTRDAEGPGIKSQLRHCRVTVLGKLFTPIVPLFPKQRNW